MKIFLTLAMLSSSLSACLPKNSEPLKLGLAQHSDSNAAMALKGLRIKELFVVIFPKDYSIPEWEAIFVETKELSRNKQRLRTLEGQDAAEAQEERANLIGKNANILTDLGSKSLFMMSWSASDENCKISKDTLKVICRPFNSENPLNGGLPKSLEPIQYLIPDPIQSDVKTPYLSVKLVQGDEAKGPKYGIELRLKPEVMSENQKWLKGDVVIQKGSAFHSQSDGTPVDTYYPFGYSELTLAP